MGWTITNKVDTFFSHLFCVQRMLISMFLDMFVKWCNFDGFVSHSIYQNVGLLIFTKYYLAQPEQGW